MIRSQSYGNALTKIKLRSQKTALLFTAITAAALDVLLLTIFIACGWKLTQLPLFVFPLVLVLFDAALILAVIKSNFRFGYSVITPILYAVVTLALSVFMVFAINLPGEVYTQSAKTVSIIAHAVISVVVILTAILGARFNKGFNVISIIAFTLCAACSIFYGAFALSNGVFGQGSLSLRPVIYEYDKLTDTYVVKDFFEGGSEKAFIPKTFNDKKVVGVAEDQIFWGLNFVEIEKNENFVMPERCQENVKIMVDKSAFEDYKSGAAQTVINSEYYNALNDNYKCQAQERLNLYNAIQPSGVDGVFITFKYTLDGFRYVDGKPIYAWFGEDGERFDINDFSSQYDYVKYSDINDENMLYTCYNDSGYMLIKPQINGEQILESVMSVPLDFEKVYAVTIGGSNDDMYSIPEEFKGENNGVRYVVKSTANNLIAENPLFNRPGFDLSWKYSRMLNGVKNSVTDLSSLLGTGDIYIHIEWKLLAPTLNEISVTGNASNSKFVYGDTVTLTATPEHTLGEQISYTYEWSKVGGEAQGSNSAYLIGDGVAYPTDSGSYKVTVTATAPSITSLSSSVSKTKSVTINKRPIDVAWTVPTDDEAIYSGTEKSFSAAVDGEFVGSDYFDLELSVAGNKTVKDAGKYQLNAEIPSKYSELYTIKQDSSKSFEITPKDVDVIWSNTTVTYNGEAQHPIATVNGVSADGIITPVSYSGTGKNAGDYEVSAVFANANYTYNNNEQQFTIEQAEATVVWGNTQFIYNGQEQKPTATATGVKGESLDLSITGAKINAGVNYTAAAELVDSTNYYLIEQTTTTTFNIDKKAVTINWANLEKEYTGSELTPTVSALGGVNGDNIEFELSGAGTDVGTYTVLATLKDTPENQNYVLDGAAVTENEFTITQKAISVIWSNLSFIYDGEEHCPTATVSVAGLTVEVSGGKTETGKYEATAKLVGEKAKNYSITNDTQQFVIKAPEQNAN